MFCILLAVAFSSGAARAQTPDAAAREVLKKTTDYVSGLDAISFDFSVDLEAVTSNGMKFQFPATGQMTLDRPSKFHVIRKGGHSEIEIVSDGESVTLYGRKLNAFAKKGAPESLDAFVRMVREERGVDLPSADLLLQNAYDKLI